MELEARAERKLEAIIALQNLQKVAREAQDHMLRGIVAAREDGGLTFQEIADILGLRAKSAAYKQYLRAKERGW